MRWLWGKNAYQCFDFLWSGAVFCTSTKILNSILASLKLRSGSQTRKMMSSSGAYPLQMLILSIRITSVISLPLPWLFSYFSSIHKWCTRGFLFFVFWGFFEELLWSLEVKSATLYDWDLIFIHCHFKIVLQKKTHLLFRGPVMIAEPHSTF